jgi:two-component system sensor histidine kinase ChiS
LKASEITCETPVIFMTALSDTADKVRAFDTGAVDYITKPIQHDEALARIRTHLTIRRLQIELQAANAHLEERVRERTAELQSLNAIYEKYVPREFIRFLGKESILDVKLGDQIASEMTVMFSDVHGWTTISEERTPEENFDFINDYFSLLSPVIREKRGFIDQYYGDGIMALFPGSPDDAIHAAIAMQRTVGGYRVEKKSDPAQLRPVKIGVGLHTGSMMLGIIGERERMQGAVVSDNVNLASRIEGLTRIYETSILISGETLERIEEPDRFTCRFVDKVQVKGKRRTVAVYEVCDADAPEVLAAKKATKASFEEGVRCYYDRRFHEAEERFAEVLAGNSGDAAAARYVERAKRYAAGGAPEGWEGVEIVGRK